MRTPERVDRFIDWLIAALGAEYRTEQVVEAAIPGGVGSAVWVGDVTVESGDQRMGSRRRDVMLTVDVQLVGVVLGGTAADARHETTALAERFESLANGVPVETDAGVCSMVATALSFEAFALDPNGRGMTAVYQLTAQFRTD